MLFPYETDKAYGYGCLRCGVDLRATTSEELAELRSKHLAKCDKVFSPRPELKKQ